MNDLLFLFFICLTKLLSSLIGIFNFGHFVDSIWEIIKNILLLAQSVIPILIFLNERKAGRENSLIPIRRDFFEKFKAGLDSRINSIVCDAKFTDWPTEMVIAEKQKLNPELFSLFPNIKKSSVNSEFDQLLVQLEREFDLFQNVS